MDYLVPIALILMIFCNYIIAPDTKSDPVFEDEFIPSEDLKFLRKKVKPERCYGTNRVLERRCCIFPPFYRAEIARKCGAQMSIADQHMKDNITTLRRQFPRDFRFWRCILYEYELLDANNETISIDRLYEHLDRWTDLNPEFKPVMTKAKRYCKINYRFRLPIKNPDYQRFQECIRNFVRTDCPKILESDPVCLEQKAFYKECQEYFL